MAKRSRHRDRKRPELSLPPLHGELKALVEQRLGAQKQLGPANPGLVFARYPRVWTSGGAPSPAKSEDRTPWLLDFAEGFASCRSTLEPLLRRQLARLGELADAQRDFRPTAPLVTGLGADHPVENGFLFHHNLGLPYLPGSSVKGLARQGARLLGETANTVSRLLGSEAPGRLPQGPRATQSSPGRVAFLDAWPTQWPSLEVDILNPHHPSYYPDQGRPLNPRRGQQGRSEIADLSEAPKPVAFLVIGPDTPFRFSLRWLQRGGSAPSDEERERVWQWLETGLEFLGIGAKTAKGYGHMVPLNAQGRCPP